MLNVAFHLFHYLVLNGLPACVVDSRSSTPANVFSGRPPSPARSPNDLAIRNIIQEKTKIESELVQIKSQHRTTQNENTELKSKVI